MIRNGNYEFLDFDKYRGLFTDVYTLIYGEEFRDVIAERIDATTYVPYTDPNTVYDYYHQSMNIVSNEIITEFKKLMGIKHISKEMADLLWDKDRMLSPLVQTIAEGYHLDKMKVEDERSRKMVSDNREKAYRLFGLNGEDRLERLQDIVRTFDKAKRIVAECHDCEVMRDVKKFESNKINNLQMFLTKLAKSGVPMTEIDNEIISQGNFDYVDAVSLDCNHIFFNNNISRPGFAYYFTSDNEAEIETSNDVFKVAEILQGRLKFYALQFEDIENPFTYVSPREIMEQEEIYDYNDYINRMKTELDLLKYNYPELNFMHEKADEIETYRKLACEELYSGCKFAKNINKIYERNAHNPHEFEWVTHFEHNYRQADCPANFIFFNETSQYSVEGLLRNLLHEIGHAIRRGDAQLDKSGMYSVERIGINTSARLVENGFITGNQESWNKTVMQMEENINERISIEALELFLKSYENIFVDNDIPYSKQKKNIGTLYQYWDFILDDFYKRYEDAIKRFPLDNNFEIFYDYQYTPITIKEAKGNYYKSKIRRIITPNAFSEKGVLSYLKVVELAQLIEVFRNQVVPVLERYDMSFNKFNNKKSNEFCSLPLETRVLLDTLKTEADSIFVSMVQDEENLREYREKLASGEIESGYANAVKSNIKDTISGVIDNGSSIVDNIIGRIVNKKKKQKINNEPEIEVIDLNDELIEDEMSEKEN